MGQRPDHAEIHKACSFEDELKGLLALVLYGSPNVRRLGGISSSNLFKPRSWTLDEIAQGLELDFVAGRGAHAQGAHRQHWAHMQSHRQCVQHTARQCGRCLESSWCAQQCLASCEAAGPGRVICWLASGRLTLTQPGGSIARARIAWCSILSCLLCSGPWYCMTFVWALTFDVWAALTLLGASCRCSWDWMTGACMMNGELA